MATARIVVNPNLAASKQLLTAIGDTLNALAELRRVKADQDMMLNGEATPGTEAAAEYGLANGAPDGLALCTIVANALAAFDVPAVAGLSKIDQG